MAATFALHEIVDALEGVADEIHTYLNKVTGEIAMVTDEEIRAIENNDDWSNYPAWQHEALELAQKILETSDYLALPSKFEIHDYKLSVRSFFKRFSKYNPLDWLNGLET